MPVANAILQYAVEQRRPFFTRPVGVLANQLDHRVLHDIQRFIPVTHGNLGDTQGAPLDIGQKPVELLFFLQCSRPCQWLAHPRYRKTAGTGVHFP